MGYFTERHGMRAPVERTSTMTVEMYGLLFDCCTRYYDHIAWKYPAKCPDGNGCCGLDYEEFSTAVRFDIPTLYRDQRGMIGKPREDYYGNAIGFDQYALLDFIELIAANCVDISTRVYHSFYRHHDLSFRKTRDVFQTFRTDINSIFEKTGLSYTLTADRRIERVLDNSPLSIKIETAVENVAEPGTRQLLDISIALFKTPHPAARQDAVEKIWDALERLKTYYTHLDKKASVSKVVEDMSDGQPEFARLFHAEFKALTDIGVNGHLRIHNLWPRKVHRFVTADRLLCA